MTRRELNKKKFNSKKERLEFLKTLEKKNSKKDDH